MLGITPFVIYRLYKWITTPKPILSDDNSLIIARERGKQEILLLQKLEIDEKIKDSETSIETLRIILIEATPPESQEVLDKKTDEEIAARFTKDGL